MPGTEIDDAGATEAATNPAGNLPRFQELLPRQAAGLAHDACNPMEMAVALEAAKIVTSETGFRRRGEHAASMSRTHAQRATHPALHLYL